MKLSTPELLNLFFYLAKVQGSAKLAGVMQLNSLLDAGYVVVAWAKDRENIYRYLVMKGK